MADETVAFTCTCTLTTANDKVFMLMEDYLKHDRLNMTTVQKRASEKKRREFP